MRQTGVGHKDLGWTLLGQGVCGMGELRNPSCANLRTCILLFMDFILKIEDYKLNQNIFDILQLIYFE